MQYTNVIMCKSFVLQALLVCVLIYGINSISVINNVTVSSDFLSDRFYKAVHDLKDYNSSKPDLQESTKCLKSLREIMNHFPSSEVARFFDAWGNIPPGIEHGTLYNVGNFDQCIKTPPRSDQQPDPIHAQFCFAKIPLFNEVLQKNHSSLPAIPEVLEINIGICVPESCSEEFLTSVFNYSADNDNIPGISVSSCTNGEIPTLTLPNFFGILLFLVIAALVIVSSLYDWVMTHREKPKEHLLLAFSLLTNSKKLFAIDTTNTASNIGCLTGIRVLSMIMIMNFHIYSTSSRILPLTNEIDNLTGSKTLWSMCIMNTGMAVDSFFFISGLLVAWIGLQKMDKTKGILDIDRMYVHRYLRLTPVVAGTMVFVISLEELAYTGPFKDIVRFENHCNAKNFWPNLLYIQNYYHPDGMCNTETWYLAADFQLYILSPLLLIPLWKWGCKFTPVLLILALTSVGYVMWVFITNEFTGLLNISEESKWTKTNIPTHARYPPWLLGLGLGYFIHVNRKSTFRVPKILQVIAWIASFIILFGSVCGPYYAENGRATVFEAALYGGWKHFSWGVSLAWITFACYFGFGGVVNSFLSHPLWQPLGRLSYAMYMTSLIILRINFGKMRTEVYFSNYNQILHFWSTFGMTLIAAIIVTLAFESPVLVIEKCLFGNEEKVPTEEVELATPSDTVVNVPS